MTKRVIFHSFVLIVTVRFGRRPRSINRPPSGFYTVFCYKTTSSSSPAEQSIFASPHSRAAIFLSFF